MACCVNKESREGVLHVATSSEEGAANASPHPGIVKDTGVIRVFFVEDDDLFRETVADELSEYGFAVQSFADGRSLLESAEAAAVNADVIILDWGLPGTSGIDLLPELRKRGVNLPVVFLTGYGLTTNESLAFERGAIDFVDKTRGVAVLARRLRLVVKTAKPPRNPQPDNRMVCGKLVLRPNVSRAYWNDVDVGLTIGEFNLVHLLAANVGQYVTYRTIYDQLHYEGFVAGTGKDGYRTNVRSVIKRIRRKFFKFDSTFAEIENSTAVGYCWRKPDAD